MFTIRCEMSREPSVDNHSMEIFVTDSENVTKNEYNASVLYDNAAGENKPECENFRIFLCVVGVRHGAQLKSVQ